MKYSKGDRVRLREVPIEQRQPGRLATFKHDFVKVGDEGTVQEYELHDDGDETVLVLFDQSDMGRGIGLYVYPEQIEPASPEG